MVVIEYKIAIHFNSRVWYSALCSTSILWECDPWFLLIAYGVTHQFNSSKITPIHHAILRTKIMQMKYMVLNIHLHKILIILSTVLQITYAQKSKLKRMMDSTFAKYFALFLLSELHFPNIYSGRGHICWVSSKSYKTAIFLSRKTGQKDRHAHQHAPANFIRLAKARGSPQIRKR